MPEDKLFVEMRIVDKGKLKAFADVTFPSPLGELTVRSFRVVQEDGKLPWVGFPTISYEKNGKQINKSILEVPRVLKNLVVEAILTEFNRQSRKGIELPARPQRI
jgi:hypothetical protein